MVTVTVPPAHLSGSDGDRDTGSDSCTPHSASVALWHSHGSAGPAQGPWGQWLFPVPRCPALLGQCYSWHTWLSGPAWGVSAPAPPRLPALLSPQHSQTSFGFPEVEEAKRNPSSFEVGAQPQGEEREADLPRAFTDHIYF